jgi:Glyoxalase/Bleomycin resistance protein/Dioxygenase superfamily
VSAGLFFHVGILVEDLDRAVEQLSSSLGLSFLEHVISRSEFEQDGRRAPCEVRVSFARQEPPYLELMEAHLRQAPRRGPLSHRGVGAGLRRPAARLRKHGVRADAVQFNPEGKVLVAFLSPRHLSGIRWEIVDESRRETFEAWQAGRGVFTDCSPPFPASGYEAAGIDSGSSGTTSSWSLGSAAGTYVSGRPSSRRMMFAPCAIAAAL